MMQLVLPLAGGHHVGPLFVIRKQRPLARPPGKQGIVHRAQTVRATPPWADQAAIRKLYAEARALTKKRASYTWSITSYPRSARWCAGCT